MKTLADSIAAIEDAVSTASPSSIPYVLGELRRLDAILQVRLLTPAQPDQLLTAKDAAALLSISPDTLYRRADEYPFTVRHARRVRFSRRGIEDWLASHRECR